MFNNILNVVEARDGSDTYVYDIDDIIGVLTKDVAELKATGMAIEKCVDMISSAVSRGVIKIRKGGKAVEDENHFRLNVKPNFHETAAEFWKSVAQRLLRKGECLIVQSRTDGQLYIAESWTETDHVLKERTYRDITLICGEKTMAMKRQYRSSEVMHIRYKNSELRKMTDSFCSQFSKTVDALNAASKSNSIPKYSLTTGGNISIVDKKTGAVLTANDYAERIGKQISSDKTLVIALGNGFSLSEINKTESKAPEKLSAAIKQAEEAVAKAFNVPITVYNGTVTEKSDADNEFITYAVKPLVKPIEDALNGIYVGMEDYTEGRERISFFLGQHKHKDIVESAQNLEKLRGIGFTLDEIYEFLGLMPLETDFSTRRVITKNFGDELGTEDRNDSNNEE